MNARGPIETSRITRELGIPSSRKRSLRLPTRPLRPLDRRRHPLPRCKRSKKRRALAYVVWSFLNIDGKLHLKELVEQVDALT